MSTIDSNDVEVIVNESRRQKFIEILKNNEILDEVDAVTMKEPAALKGQNMGSSSVYVQIKFKDPEIKPKNLFVKKWHENSPGHTEIMKSGNVMRKEAEFLRDFIPFGKEFCKKYPGCETFLDCFPKCLYGDEEMLVLENLVLDDIYVMLPKENFQDLDTAKFVLTNLAKFHATTSVMIEEMGVENLSSKFKLVTTDLLTGPLSQVMVQMINNTVNSTMTLLKNNPVDGSEYAVEKLKMFIGKGQQLLEECCLNDSHQWEKFLCINHGDCWNNNMLFKIDPKTGKLYDHVFVDLQITRLGSLSYDVSYYLYLSVKSEVRRRHLKELLRHYYDEFKQAVENGFGKKCNFTFEELIGDFKRCHSYAFFISIGAASTVQALKYVDLTKMGSNPADMADVFQAAIDKWIQENPDESNEHAIEDLQNINFHFNGFS